MKYLIVLITLLELSGCSMRHFDNSGYAWEEWHKPGIKPTPNVVWQDMKSCGFNNSVNNIQQMTREEYIKSSFCMEDKGYLLDKGETTCDSWYRKLPLCQERIKQGK